MTEMMDVLDTGCTSVPSQETVGVRRPPPFTLRCLCVIRLDFITATECKVSDNYGGNRKQESYLTVVRDKI